MYIWPNFPGIAGDIPIFQVPRPPRGYGPRNLEDTGVATGNPELGYFPSTGSANGAMGMRANLAAYAESRLMGPESGWSMGRRGPPELAAIYPILPRDWRGGREITGRVRLAEFPGISDSCPIGQYFAPNL